MPNSHFVHIMDMLVKVNSIKGDRASVTKLDIDDFGSVIPIKEMELSVPASDDSVGQTLRNSPYAAVFTEGDGEEPESVIILARGITADELNEEKERTIHKVQETKRK